jgi:hypothetical protein
MKALLTLVILGALGLGVWFCLSRPGEIKVQGDAQNTCDCQTLTGQSALWDAVLRCHRGNNEKPPYLIFNIEKSGGAVHFGSGGLSTLDYKITISGGDGKTLYEKKHAVRTANVWKQQAPEHIKAAARDIMIKYLREKPAAAALLPGVLKESKNKEDTLLWIQLILDAKAKDEKITRALFDLALSAADADVRLAALNGYKNLAEPKKGGDEIREGARKLLADTDAGVRESAAGLVAETAGEKDIRELLRVFVSSDAGEAARLGAGAALAKTGPAAGPVLPEIFACAKTADSKIKKQGIAALRAAGSKDPEIIKWVRDTAENLKNPADLRSEAVKAYLVFVSPWKVAARQYKEYSDAPSGGRGGGRRGDSLPSGGGGGWTMRRADSAPSGGGPVILGDTKTDASITFLPNGKALMGKSELDWDVDNMILKVGPAGGEIGWINSIFLKGASGDYRFEWTLTQGQPDDKNGKKPGQTQSPR